MDQQAIIADIEARAKAKGLTMQTLCEMAKVHPTTVSRWKLSEKNPDPIGATIKSLTRLSEAVDAAPAQQVAA